MYHLACDKCRDSGPVLLARDFCNLSTLGHPHLLLIPICQAQRHPAASMICNILCLPCMASLQSGDQIMTSC